MSRIEQRDGDGIEVSAAARYRQASLAPATRAAYRSDLADLVEWLSDSGRNVELPLEPDDVADYLAFAATHGLKPSTLTRRVAAIATAHRLADLASPTATAVVTRTLSGIRRHHGVAPDKARALETDDIVRMLDATPPDGPKQLRDRALLVLGFAGALRRSELVGLDVDDVDERRDGLVVTLRHAKSDQEGAGRDLGIARGDHPTTCAVANLRAWLHGAAITHGPIFRAVDRHGNVSDNPLTGRSVARIYKTLARNAGIDPTRVSGHSVRAGHATTAAASGAPDRTIMATTGHRDRRTLDGYVRTGQILDDTSSRYLGL